ncbi:D-aminoacyl-tRNA deacylase [Flavobacterium sp. SM2513]|uniref:D-aminoacyl-tRNA deacylase n=1 Tax=Flavobacterium sp. SM2513 TaxID=3424766 RepID=UPI003D7F7F33
MKAVIQRVSAASVTIDNKISAQIEAGLLIFIGIETADSQEDIQWLCSKIANLRIFADENEVMNKSVKDIDGDILVVSQFTLHASTKKGNRPSYIYAARPEIAIPLYESFLAQMSIEIQKPIQSGTFGADMKVALINDGPVTILIDTKNKE